MNRDLFGSPITKQGHYIVYHDESEPEPNKGWLLIGLLFVKEEAEGNVLAALWSVRKRHNYEGEIHFSDLPKSFGGEFGAKARVAKDWLLAYQNNLCNDALFSCLAVDRRSPSFEHKRFSQDHHVYNRFTAMAIKAAVAWHLGKKDYDVLQLALKSDAKSRKSSPDQGMIDNFEKYIPQKVEREAFVDREIKGKTNPQIIMKPLQLASSGEHDLLQLTDLLLGAFQCALIGKSTRPAKRELARLVASWVENLRLEPWKQKHDMHRKFNVWGFPNSKGRPFNRFQLAISSIPDAQLSIFPEGKEETR